MRQRHEFTNKAKCGQPPTCNRGRAGGKPARKSTGSSAFLTLLLVEPTTGNAMHPQAASWRMTITLFTFLAVLSASAATNVTLSLQSGPSTFRILAAGNSGAPILSSDGRYVAFASTAGNLIAHSNQPLRNCSRHQSTSSYAIASSTQHRWQASTTLGTQAEMAIPCRQEFPKMAVSFYSKARRVIS